MDLSHSTHLVVDSVVPHTIWVRLDIFSLHHDPWLWLVMISSRCLSPSYQGFFTLYGLCFRDMGPCQSFILFSVPVIFWLCASMMEAKDLLLVIHVMMLYYDDVIWCWCYIMMMLCEDMMMLYLSISTRMHDAYQLLLMLYMFMVHDGCMMLI